MPSPSLTCPNLNLRDKLIEPIQLFKSFKMYLIVIAFINIATFNSRIKKCLYILVEKL